MSQAIQLLCSTSHIRFYEQFAQHQLNLSEDKLMSKAGQAAFDIFVKYYPRARHIAVYCGGGNNAGDGYVFARMAHESGYNVQIFALKNADLLPPAAHNAALAAHIAGVPCLPLHTKITQKPDLIVDALLGIGLQAKVKPELRAVIQAINESGVPILALDIPSGLHADTGRIEGICINASITVTFIALKLGLVTGNGPDYCGHIFCDNLGLNTAFLQKPPAAYYLSAQGFSPLFPTPRPRNSHKGNFGQVLVVGGGKGMLGAALMAAGAAISAGAGLVTIATLPSHACTAVEVLPEALCFGIQHADELKLLLDKATVCLVGPGLGEDIWAKELLTVVLSSSLPLIIDASALRLLAKAKWRPTQECNINLSYTDWILTPHPGEAAALLNCSTQEIEQDRYQALLKLQKQFGGYAILKGVGSLISQGEGEMPYVCGAGNPGMASAGMGDVLSGIIAALVAQHMPLAKAATMGTWIHATAGDAAARQHGERGLKATDLIPYVCALINQYPLIL